MVSQHLHTAGTVRSSLSADYCFRCSMGMPPSPSSAMHSPHSWAGLEIQGTAKASRAVCLAAPEMTLRLANISPHWIAITSKDPFLLYLGFLGIAQFLCSTHTSGSIPRKSGNHSSCLRQLRGLRTPTLNSIPALPLIAPKQLFSPKVC